MPETYDRQYGKRAHVGPFPSDPFDLTCFSHCDECIENDLQFELRDQYVNIGKLKQATGCSEEGAVFEQIQEQDYLPGLAMTRPLLAAPTWAS